MAAPGRGHLGDPRRTPAFHALQGHGLGSVRSGRRMALPPIRPASGQARWRQVADEIHEEVCRLPSIRTSAASCSSMAPGNWTRACWLSRWSGFCRPRDPRVVGTVAAIERHLVRDGLVLRYDTGAGDDGLPPGEGAFLACSFWLADVLVLLGRHDDARRLFERLRASATMSACLPRNTIPCARRYAWQLSAGFQPYRADQYRA